MGLLGIFSLFVLLEAGLRLGGFVLFSIQEHANLQAIRQKGAYRILCLGESTTQGEFPKPLEQILNQRKIGVRFSVIDKGRSATNTMAILGEVDSYLAEYHPDMVVAMMGINDKGVRYYQDIPETDSWLFRHCRAYRFGRILCMHISKKINQKDIYGLNKLDPGKKSRPEDAAGALVRKIPLSNKIPADKTMGSDSENKKESPGSSPQPFGAKKLLKKDAGLNFKNANAHLELGMLYLNQGKFSEAEDSFKKVIGLSPEAITVSIAYFGLGRLYKERGNFPQAEDAFKKALEFNPKNDSAYVELGWFYQSQGKFSQAEDVFKKLLELNPQNDKPYVGLGALYHGQGKSLQAEDAFKRAIELNPKNEHAYDGLGWLYRDQSKFSQAESFFKKAIELNPENAHAYLGLGSVYLYQSKFAQAEDVFKRAIELNPKDAGPDSAYIGLGRVYRLQNKCFQYEELFKKTIEINPKNDSAYFELGGFYLDQGKFSQAEDAFKRVIKLVSESDRTYLELGGLYRKQGQFSKAEDSFKRALEISPTNERVLGAMASLYEEMGKSKPVKEYAQKADQLRSEDNAEATVGNYRKLKKILDRQRIQLVCVQYPMRGVNPLKKIFAEDKGIIFVDNESLFKDAVKRSNYKEYFRDMFAGDFGHCTQKGNELLAKNIADVILREVFNK